jgi:radical SAM protein with 4Fe4S-binding SPASM domain
MKAKLPFPGMNVEIELSNLCQLKCPFCRTGGLRQQYPQVDRGFMDMNTIKAILDKATISFAQLFNWGEPLMNPDVVSLVTEVTRRGIKCELGTNLQNLAPDKAFGLVQSGLTRIRISCDGITQESYEKYRIGGNLQLLLHNAEMLVDAKKRNNNQGPELLFQIVVNKWNHHEIGQYEQFAKSHGADNVTFSGLCAMTPEGWHLHKEWACSDKQYSCLAVGNATSCYTPWDRLSFDWNGDIYNCCNPVGLTRYKLGNIHEVSNIEDIWNGEKMRYIRRYCSSKRAENVSFDIPCYRCFGVFPSEEKKKSDEYYSCFLAMEQEGK